MSIARVRVTCHPAGALLVLAVGGAGLAAGCGGPRVRPVHAVSEVAIAAAIAPPTIVRAGALPDGPEAWSALGDGTAAIVLRDGWRPAPVALTDDQRQGLSGFVERGGRLLLLGHAAVLVSAIGIEPQTPETETFRWGFDDRTAVGHAQIGFRLVSGRLPQLTEGMAHADGHEHGFFLTGGQPCCVPLCSWRIGEPARGEVLGRLLRQRDGRTDDATAPVLVRWSHGRGEVLACGLLPAVDAGDPVHVQNGRALLQQASAWLGNGRAPAELLLWQLPHAPLPEPPAAQAPFAQRELPAAPLCAHWGWQAPAQWLHDREPRDPDDLLAQVLLPSWRAGADLFELDLGDRERGLPLAWSAADPLRRPAEWRGDAFWPRWQPATIGRLVAEAHARGMLAQLSLDPLPVAATAPGPRLAALRWLARELADVRRLPQGAFDGFSLRRWFPDPDGLSVATLQDLHPGAFLVAVGERMGGVGGALGALDADDGTPRGAAAAGLSAGWRDGFPADRFPAGVLDARAVRVPASRWGADVGGGSHGDWIAAQAADFVRARLGGGAAMLWRAHAGATLAADTVEYVHGVSVEPLRAAVAATCTATGTDGWRCAQRALLPDVQPGFGADLPVPAAAPLLQNNWFRLHGTGGSWSWDPQGLARFRPGESRLLARELFRTRLSGGRPSAAELRAPQVDWLAHGARGSGGYQEEVRVRVADPVQRRPPQVLAFDAQPEWPRRAALDLDVGQGYFELDLQLRAVHGQGTVAVRLDDTAIAFVPFAEGRPVTGTVVPLHLARAGLRTLTLEVGAGGAAAVDVLRLVRRGDVAAEASVGVPAGSMAEVVETSASSYHAERSTLRTLADMPGFLWRAECTAAARNLQLERVFSFEQHRRLAATTAGEGPGSLRAPFVLAAAEPDLPELAVVPLQMSRYERFELRAGRLVLESQPEPGATTVVGFLLLQQGERQAFERLRDVFLALDRPLTLDLGTHGQAALPGELPFAWTRVLHVAPASPTPFLVRERGWWTWRGGQALRGGDALLRVVSIPGDTVEIVAGAAVLARTRPGPGSLHTVALRDPQPDRVTVRVLQRSPLGPPSVTMAADFVECFVDGRPWNAFSGRTVLLPDREGTCTVTTRRHDGAVPPHLVATRARLEQCHWDASARELVLVAAGDDARPAELAFTAAIAGPEPIEVVGGERVPEAELRHGDAGAKAAAVAAGVVIRFRPGLVKVRYGNP